MIICVIYIYIYGTYCWNFGYVVYLSGRGRYKSCHGSLIWLQCVHVYPVPCVLCPLFPGSCCIPMCLQHVASYKTCIHLLACLDMVTFVCSLQLWNCPGNNFLRPCMCMEFNEYSGWLIREMADITIPVMYCWCALAICQWLKTPIKY